MHVLNGKDFHARVIAEHGADTDALVYFAYANAHPRTHRVRDAHAEARGVGLLKGEFIFIFD